MTPIISLKDAYNQLNAYKFIDASWALDGSDRKKVYEQSHIEGAHFFDIDLISDKSQNLPHMAPTPLQFAKAVGDMGISEHDTVIIYDQFGLFSAARVWWTFHLMGHQNVAVLGGGLPAWQAANFPVTDAPTISEAVLYQPHYRHERVTSRARLNDLIGHCKILDARPADRFLGKAPEPRAGLRSGHMPTAQSLPISQLIENGALKNQSALLQIFSGLGIQKGDTVITTCGSGVTAAIISLALECLGHDNKSLYDGSWAEWGQKDLDTDVI